MGHSRVDWAGSARRLERAAHRGERAQASHRGGVHVVGRLPSLACGLLELRRLGEAARLVRVRVRVRVRVGVRARVRVRVRLMRRGGEGEGALVGVRVRVKG